MIDALDNIKYSQGNLDKMKQAMLDLKAQADKYLEAKEKQIHWLPSARHEQRKAYAETLKALADNTLKAMENPEISKLMSKEVIKDNAKENVQTDAAKHTSELLHKISGYIL